MSALFAPFAILLAISSTSANATGGIACQSADGKTGLNVLVSLTGEGVGSGVVSLLLTRPGEPANAAWKVTAARADYRRKTLALSATAPEPEPAGQAARQVPQQAPLRLTIRQSVGTLDTRGERVRLACDWGEFS